MTYLSFVVFSWDDLFMFVVFSTSVDHIIYVLRTDKTHKTKQNEQHIPTKNWGTKHVLRNGSQFLLPLEAPVVLLLLETRW